MRLGDLQRAQAYAILRSIGEGMAFYEDCYRDWKEIILMITLLDSFEAGFIGSF